MTREVIRGSAFLGSARFQRAGEAVLGFANFLEFSRSTIKFVVAERDDPHAECVRSPDRTERVLL